MKTQKQQTGDDGESIIIKYVKCPSCKYRRGSLRKLPTNFKCADIICDFCGYLAQVKSFKMTAGKSHGKVFRGAGWNVQKERLDAGIYYPLFLVGIDRESHKSSIWYLPADLQSSAMFVKLPSLKGRKYSLFNIHLDKALSAPIRFK